ncbi:50S ribosomal protein L10 [bacterium]|nr:50S ribosomal protein L10 [bacterium]
MAISRERKEELVAKYTDILEGASGLVVTEYRGMKMPQITEIRRALRETGGDYLVTKNRLLKIALRNIGMPAPEELLNGPVAVGFARQDLPGMVKVLLDKAKTQELLKLKGAIVGSTVMDESGLDALSKLPTIEELRAQILGMLIQPMQGVLGVLQAPPQGLVGVLQAGSTTLVNVLAAYAAKEDNVA